ncbi:MAG: hypothetical protein KJP02_01890 [Octadecabacter sp.]|nr:hypothetical protein [Octadecabacter sp.]
MLQAAGNSMLFEQQLRIVPKIVGVFHTKLNAERNAALRYDLARQELQMALVCGTFIDGEDF